MKVPFNTLKPRYAWNSRGYIDAVSRVLDRGWFVLGPELEAFEHEFSVWLGGGYTIGVANGTDAIELALRAAGVGTGDEVITVAHTAVATVCAIERAGATPVLVDIDPVTYTMDPAAARAAITSRTRALVPVHIYGHPADLAELTHIARAHNLLLIEDCAQAHGATYAGNKVGTFGDMAAFSFYPTKNLGAFGDAGAVYTRSALFADRLIRLRNYGQTKRYHHAEPGINSRLDEIQAAFLRLSLSHLDDDNRDRRRIAAQYNQKLRGVVTPRVSTDPHPVEHAYHLYVVRHTHRDPLQRKLEDRGIGTLIHYPVPVHRQPAYQHLGMQSGSLPVTERIASEILSLPMYAGLPDQDIHAVITAVNTASMWEAA